MIPELTGTWKILCSASTTVIAEDSTRFSTDMVAFLNPSSSGIYSFRFYEFTSTECPIYKYEITAYTSTIAGVA